MDNSSNKYIKFSFRDGLDPNFLSNLSDAIMKKAWEITPILPMMSDVSLQNKSEKTQLPVIKTRTGIIGIERSLQERQRATDDSISMAFQDLKKLMEMAKDMVSISKTISAKIKVFIDLFKLKNKMTIRII